MVTVILQVSRTWISNYITQYTVNVITSTCTALPASDTKVLIYCAVLNLEQYMIYFLFKFAFCDSVRLIIKKAHVPYIP